MIMPGNLLSRPLIEIARDLREERTRARAEHRRAWLVGGRRVDAQHPDERHLGCLLCKGRNRNAESECSEGDTPHYSITSSARARIAARR
jgi:hypothetical protein